MRFYYVFKTCLFHFSCDPQLFQLRTCVPCVQVATPLQVVFACKVMQRNFMLTKQTTHGFWIRSPTVTSTYFFIFSEEADEGEWNIKEVVERFQSDNERGPWRTSLKGGVDLDEKTWKGISSRESTTNGNMDYVARYDLTFLMPLGNEIRFKVRAPVDST